MFKTLVIVTFETRAISPRFLAVAMLFVIKPLSYVKRPVSMLVSSLSVGHISLPFSIVKIAVRMPKLPHALRLIIDPFAFVFAFRPYQNAINLFVTLCI